MFSTLELVGQSWLIACFCLALELRMLFLLNKQMKHRQLEDKTIYGPQSLESLPSCPLQEESARPLLGVHSIVQTRYWYAGGMHG